MSIKSILLTITILFLSISVHASTVSYTLDNIILDDGSKMTGAFDWTYDTIEDFGDGSGVFTALDIPYNPGSLDNSGMVFTIENNQIEISLDVNLHDTGLGIILKFVQPLSPIQSSLIDLNTSFFECCGNGFKDQPFISGSISPAVSSIPAPAAVWLFGSGIVGLVGLARRKKV